MADQTLRRPAAALHAGLFDNAVVIGSAVTQVLGVAAKRFGIYLSIGIDEREPAGSTLYNTQLLFGPAGDLLPGAPEARAHRGRAIGLGMGDGSGLKVVETPFGRIGTLTCWENYMPLARAALYEQGVDIYLAPTWDNSDVWPSTMKHIAKEGRVFVVGVNHCLRARSCPPPCPGGTTSTATGRTGWPGQHHDRGSDGPRPRRSPHGEVRHRDG